MADDLTGLGPQGFERLCQALATCVLGPGIEVFGAGPDGGREASFAGLPHYPSPQDPWAGYGFLQAKFKTVVRGTPADVAWLRKQVMAELEAWGDPARRRVSQGRRPQYLIIATNVSLSAVPGTGGKDRLDKLIGQYAGVIGLKDWRVWDAVQITALLDANPRIRRAFAATITPSDVLAQLRDRLDEPPVVSVVLGAAAIAPGEPGCEAAFQEAYDAGGGAQRFGSALGKVAEDGPGWVQHFTAGPGCAPAVICALHGRPAAGVARSLWNALQAVGGGIPGGGTTGAGYPAVPAGDHRPVIGDCGETVALEGGGWGRGQLVPAGPGEWRWEPEIAFDSNACRYQDTFDRRDGTMDLRLRVAANIPLAADMRIAGGRYTMHDSLREAGISDFITALAARYGAGRHGWDWEELGEPSDRNNSRQASYHARVIGRAGSAALAGYAWLSLPGASQNGLLAIVDLRFSFAGIRPGPDGTGTPIAAELRVSPSELVDFFTSAWQAATMVLPSAATSNPAALPPSGAPRLELYIQNERPEFGGTPRPRRMLDMVDLSAYGQPRARQLRDLSVGVTARIGLADAEIRSLVRQGLIRMTEDYGFTGATTTTP
jgi:hypothetical protein